MTQEEKARAYDEALEKARMYRDNAKAVEDYSAVARYENIFPELQEKPLTPFQQCLNLILHKVYYASVPGKIVDIDKFILDTVKSHTNELVALAKRHEYTDCQLHESEDERIRKKLIKTIGYFRSRGIDQQLCEEFLAWLEKQEQKPAWSEEDERVYDILLNEFKQLYDGRSTSLSRKEVIDVYNFLKSIRPSWKPSEEHLSALLAVFNDPNNIGSQTCQLALTDLYEQLKKL